MKYTPECICPKCNWQGWDWANIGFTDAIQCTDCGYIYPKPKKTDWVEITKGQIDACLKHSDNYDFAWAIEHICRLNNGYAPHENFKPEWSESK